LAGRNINKCPSRGYKKGWLTGYEIERRYNISVILVPLEAYMSPICICGHHAKYHKNPGSAGICTKCTKCEGEVHNFIPREHAKVVKI